jgi:hypothetical protein
MMCPSIILYSGKNFPVQIQYPNALLRVFWYIRSYMRCYHVTCSFKAFSGNPFYIKSKFSILLCKLFADKFYTFKFKLPLLILTTSFNNIARLVFASILFTIFFLFYSIEHSLKNSYLKQVI